MFDVTGKRSLARAPVPRIVALLARLADAIAKPRCPECSLTHLSDHLKRDIGIGP